MKVVNFEYVFGIGRVDQTAVDIINAQKTIHNDKKGQYVEDAKLEDDKGNVSFHKRYIKILPSGIIETK